MIVQRYTQLCVDFLETHLRYFGYDDLEVSGYEVDTLDRLHLGNLMG